jgi:hypothetical protein
MSEKEHPENPLLKALPPATDYLTYLTIIEYNLSEENLPVLHTVLQDTDLTINIGWDLIQLLLPFVPASDECLGVIASKGNPRECILKVTEALRLLEFEDHEEDSDEERSTQTGGPFSTTAVSNEAKIPNSTPASAPPTAVPQSVIKFEVLLSLLSTLHRRIKTKYPSRFLSTSLQAVLSAYNKATHHHAELTLAAVKFIKTLSGTKRPHLPPRTSTADLLRRGVDQSEPDPEAQPEPPTSEEDTLVNRLLQSFITHILEDWMLSLTSSEDVPGLAWPSRLMEKFDPRRVVPNKTTYAERFANEEALQSRAAIIGQLVALAQDLGVSTEELFRTVKDSEHETQGVPGAEDEPPENASDIPLSKTGSLLLFAARKNQKELYASAGLGEDGAISIFPDHSTILTNFIGTLGPQAVGLEPEPLLDAILSLGLISLHHNKIGEPADDEQFEQYLQTLSLVSANCPSPSLRYHAHYLVSTILRSHPSDLVRLTFIRDTLAHCPYENLKASAVGWLKGETLEANIPQPEDEKPDTAESIFSTPVALSEVSPFLFPDLTSSWTSAVEISESWMEFRMELGFYLAALNFYYLLLTAKMLHENLAIAGLHKRSRIETTYLAPLKQAIVKFREALKEDGELAVTEGPEGIGQALMDLALLEDVIARVEKGAGAL